LRCVEQLAFVLLSQPEEQRGPLLVQVLKALVEYGQREGWRAADALEFTTQFGDATVVAMRRQTTKDAM
jgi:hypothetical protein